MFFEVKELRCNYGHKEIIKGISFSLEQGDIGCLLGPSGGGKTTLLRAIAGLQPPVAGSITLDGDILDDKNHCMRPESRQVGLVFQKQSLFPHMNVADNITFGLHKEPRDEANKKLTEMLQLMDLEGLGKRFPHQLSGGEQQRVTLARALVMRPRLLLLDEPLANLDTPIRRRLATFMRESLEKWGVCALLVTHDEEEAFIMAQQIGVLNEGKIEQWGTPYDLYHEPCNRYVAKFIGRGTLLRGTMLDNHRVQTSLGVLSSQKTMLPPPGTPVDVLMRPDDIISHDEASEASILATVRRRIFFGSHSLYYLELKTGEHIEALFTYHHDYPVNSTVNICVQARHLIVYDASQNSTSADTAA